MQALHIQPIPEAIVTQLDVGVVAVDRAFRVLLWNDFMTLHSGLCADECVGILLFDLVPDLPEPWLRRKITKVFSCGRAGRSTWERRPHIFPFREMRQNLNFIPIKDFTGAVSHVCVTVTDVTAHSIQIEKLQEACNRDGLTGIYNRRYLEKALEIECARVRRYGGTVSFLLFDMDNFKAVNDNHGHLVGDEVLRHAAQSIEPRLRSVDLLGRYGGEEFGVILPATGLTGASVVAERILQRLAECPIQLSHGQSLTVTASVGVAEWDSHAPSHLELIRRADEVLYQSKSGGRNRVTLYRPAGSKALSE